MVKRSTRKNTSRGLISRVYSPIHHTLSAAKSIVDTGLTGIDKMGLSLTGHANAAIRNVFSRKGGKSRRAERKSRKAERKSRKAERKSRKAERKSRKASRRASRK
jgi:hypothetical protein